MRRKPKIFLLDAGPVIRLHELGLWDAVVDRTELIPPGIVARQEAHFWLAAEGRRSIDLVAEASGDRIRIVDVDVSDLATTRAIFDSSITDSVHEGELEALTVLRLCAGPMPRFCTADRLATIALCLLGFADAAISLQALLGEIGLARDVGPRWYTEVAMQSWLNEGRRRSITREGLAR